jgi:hypothetical protein
MGFIALVEDQYEVTPIASPRSRASYPCLEDAVASLMANPGVQGPPSRLPSTEARYAKPNTGGSARTTRSTQAASIGR